MEQILVTGANGQLGSELRLLSAQYKHIGWHFVGHSDLDITDSNALARFFEQHPITTLINCAAYTAVDKAETNYDQAYAINATAVGNLAQLCHIHKAQFIHISTDFVFDGTQNTPYHPHQTVNPIGVYAQTKYAGEQLAMQHNPNSLIIRTAWVYSAFGNNFPKTMLRLFAQQPNLNIVYDQVGCPTYAADIATALLHIIIHQKEKAAQGGIFHYVNAGVASWYDLAMAVRQLSGSNCILNAIESHQYPTPAKRPHYSVLATNEIRATFGVQTPYWHDALARWWTAINLNKS